MRQVGNMWIENVLPVGTKVKFVRFKRMYTVRASNVAFAVCTQPINMIRRLGRGKYEHEKTVLYTIIDWHFGIRGTENLIFGMGAESDQHCKDMLERLTNGESEVSHRNRVDLDIERIVLPPWKKRYAKNSR